MKQLFFLTLIFIINSCEIGSDLGCGESYPYDVNIVSLNLIEESTGLPLVDNVMNGGLFDPYNSMALLNGENDDSPISITFDIDDWVHSNIAIADSIYSLNYLLRLKSYSGKIDEDTLIVNYSIIEGKCQKEIDNLEIIYNGVTKYSGYQKTNILIPINKL